jgi:hypothetical protein
MYYTYTRPTSPAVISWAQMQAQLRVVTDDEQQFVTDLVDACTEYAEQALDSSLLTRTITAVYDAPSVLNPGGFIGSWPSNWHNGQRFFLPRGPVPIGGVVSITDTNGKSLSFTQDRSGFADYAVLTPDQNFVSPLTIVYSAGYGSAAANVPGDICMAIRLHASTLFEQRASTDEKQILAVPHSLEAFYANRKRTAPVG